MSQEMHIKMLNLLVYIVFSDSLTNYLSFTYRVAQRLLCFSYLFYEFFFNKDQIIINIISCLCLLILSIIDVVETRIKLHRIINSLLIYKNIFLKVQTESSVILTQQKNQILLSESNQKGFKNLDDLIKYLNQIGFEFIQNLPLSATSLQQLIEILFQNPSGHIFSLRGTIINSYSKLKDNVSLFIAKIKTNDKQISIIITIQNESYKEQQRLNHQKDMMIASLNHDLKNPIISTKMVLKKIKQSLENGIVVDLNLINSMNSMQNMALNLTNQFMDYTLANAGKIKLAIKKFSLQNSLQFISNLMKEQCANKQISLQFNFQYRDMFFLNDENRMIQVIVNFITNAIKFSPKQTEINVNTIVFHELNLIQIEVQDHGLGIPQNNLQLIGEPFNTFNQKGLNSRGNGIGLYLSKNIIQQIGPCQSFVVESVINEGSKFSFLMYINQEQEFDLNLKNKIKKCENQKSDIIEFLFQENENIKLKTNQQDQNYITFNEITERYIHSSIFNKLQSEENRQRFFSYDQIFAQSNHALIQMKCGSHQNNNHKQIIMDQNIFSKTKKNLKASFEKLSAINPDQNSYYELSLSEQKYITVLIVDDDIIVRDILKENIEKMVQNIIVLIAKDGQEGLDLFKSRNQFKNANNISLIITDIKMNPLKGYEMANIIFQHINTEGYQKVRIISQSSNESEKLANKCYNAGIEKVFKKPLKYKTLYSIIQSLK